MGLIFWMHKFHGLFKYNPVTIPSYLLWYGLFAVTGVIVFWFRDIIREAVYMGYHTTFVQSNLRLGFMLFIVSEVMFFASFFWAFFHSSIDPSIWNGSTWPPAGIVNFFISEDISQLLTLPSLASVSETFFSYLSTIIRGDFYSPLLAEVANTTSFAGVNFVAYLLDKTDAFIDYAGISWRIFNDMDSDVSTFFDIKNDKDFDKISSTFFNLSFDAAYYDILKEDTAISLSVKLPESSFIYANNEDHAADRSVDFVDSNSINLNLYDCGTLIKPYQLPLINTFILLTSGAFLTWSHKSLRIESFKEALGSLGGVIIFAAAFVIVQFHEYLLSAFSINDGVFGSTFFMLTGFHGIHVMIGSIFLIVCAFRFLLIHFTRAHHFGYEAAIWYWHFVDVVWVFLYLFVYFWPSNFFFDYSFNWNSILPSNFDFALPTKFLTYLTDTVLDYPFHLVEKYTEVKTDVFKRFSLSVPSLITMSGVDDYFLFITVDNSTYDDANKVVSGSVDSVELSDESENFLNSGIHLITTRRLGVEYRDVDFNDCLTILTEEILDENMLLGHSWGQTKSDFVFPLNRVITFWFNKSFDNFLKSEWMLSAKNISAELILFSISEPGILREDGVLAPDSTTSNQVIYPGSMVKSEDQGAADVYWCNTPVRVMTVFTICLLVFCICH